MVPARNRNRVCYQNESTPGDGLAHLSATGCPRGPVRRRRLLRIHRRSVLLQPLLDSSGGAPPEPRSGAANPGRQRFLRGPGPERVVAPSPRSDVGPRLPSRGARPRARDRALLPARSRASRTGALVSRPGSRRIRRSGKRSPARSWVDTASSAGEALAATSRASKTESRGSLPGDRQVSAGVSRRRFGARRVSGSRSRCRKEKSRRSSVFSRSSAGAGRGFMGSASIASRCALSTRR